MLLFDQAARQLIVLRYRKVSGVDEACHRDHIRLWRIDR